MPNFTDRMEGLIYPASWLRVSWKEIRAEVRGPSENKKTFNYSSRGCLKLLHPKC